MGKDENMSQKSNANEWYRFAMMYAQAASYLMDNRGPPYEAICYLGYLSAECAMKGFLLEQGTDAPPETHNLVELCRLCEPFNSRFASLEEGLHTMEKWTTPSGFPSFEKASQEETDLALDTMQGVLLALRDQEQRQGPTLTM